MQTQSEEMGRRQYTLRGRPSFVKVLYNDFSNKLLIPPNYVRLHEETLGRKCILQPASDKQTSWCVRTKLINNHLYFKKGWKKFVKHQQLGFGDLLVFRCAKDSVFHVDIYDQTCCYKEITDNSKSVKNTARILPRKVKKVESTEAVSTAQEFMSSSEFPCFKMVLSAAYVKSNAYLHLPIDFAREHDMNGQTRYVKFVVADKIWGVKLLSDRNASRSRFTSNWIDIVKKNGLQRKDVCVFELINTQDYTFRVTIFRHTIHAEKKIRTHEDYLNSPSSRFCAKTKDFSSKAVKDATQYLSNLKQPSYAIVMQSSYLLHGYLHVPSTFFQEMHTKPGANNVKLDFSGKEYKVVFHNMGKYSRINKGWSTFVEENSLEEGDVCALELISREDIVIRISVFKSLS